MLASVMAMSLCSCGNKTKDVSIDPSYEGYTNADIQYLSYEDAERKAKAEISDYQETLDAIKDENVLGFSVSLIILRKFEDKSLNLLSLNPDIEDIA